MAKPSALSGFGPSTRIREAAEDVIGVRLGEVRRFERGIESKITHDDVHDMRVATRRLRAAMRLCGIDGRADVDVKRFQDALGAVRDIHVQLEWLEDQGKGLRGPLRKVVDGWRQRLSKVLPAKEAALKKHLTHWKAQTVPLVRASAKSGAVSFRFGGGHVRKQVRRRLRQIENGMDAFSESPDAGVAHQLRIHGKKLRYLVELLEPVWPAKVQAMLAALTPLQETFGNLHDADVRLHDIATVASTSPDSAAGLLSLLKHVEQEREKLVAEAETLVRHWRSERLARELWGLFAKGKAAVS